MSDVTAAEACKQAGVTYRQFDYWCRRGWIKAEQEQFGGSGRPRSVPWREVKILRLMGQLTAVGLEPYVAHEVARALDAHGVARLAGLGGGVAFEIREVQVGGDDG